MFSEAFVEQLAAQVAAKVVAQMSAQNGGKNLHARLFTVAEAATYLGRSVGAVEQLIKRGRLPVTKIDGKLQLDRRELDKIIDASTHYVV